MARRSKLRKLREPAPVHIDWKLIRTYKGLYRSSRGDEITIRSVKRPTKTRVFRSSAGRRKYKLVQLTSTLREVIIVAKAKTRKKAVDQEELEEIEALEDIDELEEDEEDEEIEDEVEVEEEEDEDEEEEDEEEPEDEVDEDDEEEEDEEEDEEPAPRRRAKKATPKKKKVTRSRAAKDGMVGSSEVAEHFGIEPRSLRVLLRKNKIPKDADSGTYQWRSLTSPAVVKIGKLIKSGGVRKAQQENFDKLRKRAPKKSPAKKTTATKTRRRRASEDED